MEARSEKREAGGELRPPIRSYDDLEVYQRSMALLQPVHLVARTLPSYERFELASQLRRASKSIPANIAEGYAKKRSDNEFKVYLGHALGSANEVIVHLKIAVTLGYGSQASTGELIDAYTVLAKQLYTLMMTWRTFNPSEANPIPRPASRIQLPRSAR